MSVSIKFIYFLKYRILSTTKVIINMCVSQSTCCCYINTVVQDPNLGQTSNLTFFSVGSYGTSKLLVCVVQHMKKRYIDRLIPSIFYTYTEKISPNFEFRCFRKFNVMFLQNTFLWNVGYQKISVYFNRSKKDF